MQTASKRKSNLKLFLFKLLPQAISFRDYDKKDCDLMHFLQISDNRRASPAAGPRHRRSARQPGRGEEAAGRGQEADQRGRRHCGTTAKVPLSSSEVQSILCSFVPNFITGIP